MARPLLLGGRLAGRPRVVLCSCGEPSSLLYVQSNMVLYSCRGCGRYFFKAVEGS